MVEILLAQVEALFIKCFIAQRMHPNGPTFADRLTVLELTQQLSLRDAVIFPGAAAAIVLAHSRNPRTPRAFCLRLPVHLCLCVDHLRRPTTTPTERSQSLLIISFVSPRRKGYTHPEDALGSLASPAMGHWGTCPPRLPASYFGDHSLYRL